MRQKKELVGNFRNAGSDYRPKREPIRVNVHDFEDKELGARRPRTSRISRRQVTVPVYAVEARAA
jgi:hypothetical protein